MFRLSERWAATLARERETGMGYQVVTILLKDGRRYDGVVVVNGIISRATGMDSIPFAEADIESVRVTHDPVCTHALE